MKSNDLALCLKMANESNGMVTGMHQVLWEIQDMIGKGEPSEPLSKLHKKVCALIEAEWVNENAWRKEADEIQFANECKAEAQEETK
jgi:hypothetical protein